MNKMANKVFFSKKSKAKMRARRHKVTKARGGSARITGGSSSDHREHESTTSAAAHNDTDSNEQNESNISGRKRTADRMSNLGNDDSKSDYNQKPSKSTNIVTIPADLTSKQTKKFRKEARRKARAQGQSEDEIKFVVEGQEPADPTPEEGGERNDGPANSAGERKRPKKSFPRINDLLAQHAASEKLREKLAKRTSADEALPPAERARYVAIDCEMVGVGADGRRSALARASAVDWDGAVLLDAYVRVPERVTDFRTFVSGVRPGDIGAKNDDAMDHDECRSTMEGLLRGRVLVGHALRNDLSALLLTHPKEDTRDTARYKPFMRATGRSGGKLRPRKLRDLVLEELGKRIQAEGEAHSSVDDARASMELFKVVRGRWEKELAGKKKGSRGKK